MFNVMITILFVEVSNLGYESRVLGYMVPSAFFLIFFYKKYMYKSKPVSEIKFEYKSNLLIMFPLFFSSIASWLTESVDKIMISEMLELSDVAIYSVGYKFGMVMLLLVSAFSRAWMPFVIENINNKGVL